MKNYETFEKKALRAFAKNQEAVQSVQDSVREQKRLRVLKAHNVIAKRKASEALPRTKKKLEKAKTMLARAKEQPAVPGKWPNEEEHESDEELLELEVQVDGCNSQCRYHQLERERNRIQHLAGIEAGASRATIVKNAKALTNAEKARHAAQMARLRQRFIRVLDSECQTNAWQVDEAKLAALKPQ